MLKIDQTLGRTVHYSNFTFYSTDGLGRDTYISHDNGGILKENLKPVVHKPKYPRHRSNVYRSLGRIPPSVKYHSDGSGRDTYVTYREGGQVQEFSPFNPIPLQHYLRSYDVSPTCKPSPGHTSLYDSGTNTLLNRIQKNVISRLYTSQKKKFLPGNIKMKNKPFYLNNLDNNYCPVLRGSRSTKCMEVNRVAIDCSNDDSLMQKGIKYPNLPVSPSNDNKLMHSIKKNFRITYRNMSMNNSKMLSEC